jgi:hypothetical protein
MTTKVFDDNVFDAPRLPLPSLLWPKAATLGEGALGM